jgi:probable DNA metabolism protein
VAALRVPDSFCYYLAMHKECNERILARAKKLRPEEVETSTDPEAARIKKMVYAVMGESHRMKAFVRLAPLGASVLYGYMKPRHRIGEHICDSFARRNEGTIVVLGNGRESWIALSREGGIWRDKGSGMAETLEKLKLTAALRCCQDGSGEEKAAAIDCNGRDRTDTEDLWQIYYDSQYCPDRKNLAAFKRNMPRRDQEAAGLRLVQNWKNATLDDFIGK